MMCRRAWEGGPSVIPRVMLTVSAGLFGCGSDSVEDPPEPPPAEQIVQQAVAPPPVSGGTMIAARDGITAVMADPDRDVVWIVDATSRKLVGQVDLEDRDEPTRLAEDSNGTVHVVLRSGSGIASIDLNSKQLISRRSVCPEPRGIAFDPLFPDEPALHVACAGGELVTLPLEGTTPLRTVYLDEDLRDVVVTETGALFVTRFRTAELLHLDETGTVVERLRPPSVNAGSEVFQAEVAWRTMELPDGTIAMLHQRAKSSPFKIEPGAYVAGLCASAAVVHGTISIFKIDPLGGPTPEPIVGTYLPSVVLPVDFALTSDGERFVITSVGTDQLFLAERWRFTNGKACGFDYGELDSMLESMPGQPIAMVTMTDGTVLVQLREPAALVTASAVPSQSTKAPLILSDESRFDTGHDMFHRPPVEGGIIACGSCHVEGGDDGHVWDFLDIGLRRTQNLRGGITRTAPFHWSGDLPSFPDLLHDTFVVRMGGAQPSDEKTGVISHWVDNIRYLKPPSNRDPEAVERGRALFNSEKTECSDCHQGDLFTDNETVDVGTGEELQTPGLRGVWMRAPYLHDGCATTLADRFDKCATSEHGSTSALTPEEIADLIEFLRSL